MLLVYNLLHSYSNEVLPGASVHIMTEEWPKRNGISSLSLPNRDTSEALLHLQNAFLGLNEMGAWRILISRMDSL